MSGPSAALFTDLRDWMDAGALRPLDLALTRFIAEQTPETDPAVLLAIALTSERNGHGHVCLDLAGALERPDGLLNRLRDDAALGAGVRGGLERRLSGLALTDWVERIGRCPAVADRIADPGRTDPDRDASPFVLDGTSGRPLLYLRRYWRYERRIEQGIAERLAQPIPLPEERMRALMDALFAPGADAWQKVACALAARSPFAIITGGPGTGKTTTVVRLLALLQGLTMGQKGPPLHIRLAAPTGKAAARLNESIAGRVADLDLAGLADGEAVRREIPTQVTTLHRLLGPIRDSRHFRHHAGNPLPADLVVVDEASMVDVEMMARLLDALRPEARLILLGDKDQLASVEAGAVLGDLCQRARAGRYSADSRDWLEHVTGERVADEYLDTAGGPLDQAVAMLRRSYRFRAEGGIGALAELVNTGTLDLRRVGDRLAAVKELFARQPAADSGLGRITAIRLKDSEDKALDTLALNGYRTYLETMRARDPGDAASQAELDQWAREVIESHGGFQLLTALRQGPWGVEGLNRRVVEILSRGADPLLRPRTPVEGAAAGAAEGWFAGRPVLVTRNDPGLRLMNGDIGITLPVPVRQDAGGIRTVLRVAFPAGDGTGGIRWILPSRLQAVETVFAMTVHKSQGSEFTHTALILPDAPNPVLTRELLYTGITRSREAFTLLYSRDGVLGDALERRVVRVSGISTAAGAHGETGKRPW